MFTFFLYCFKKNLNRSGLANCLSRYYSRVRVLREPLPGLLPTLHARIHLLEAVQAHIGQLLNIMGLSTLRRM
jgi:arginyl-tRNA synthetase